MILLLLKILGLTALGALTASFVASCMMIVSMCIHAAIDDWKLWKVECLSKKECQEKNEG